MNPAHDRLEVVDVERPRVEVSIPADHVQWMVVEHDLVDTVVLLYQDGKITHLVDCLDMGWTADVALRVRRALYQLPEFIPITLRPAYMSAALEDEHLRRSAAEIEPIAVQDSAVDDEIVALAERKNSISGLEHSFALAHVNELVRLGVAIEMRVVLVRLAVQHRDVLIEQKRDAIERDAASLLRA